MAIIGNTLRLRFEFRTFEGQYADPEEIVLRIKELNRIQLLETMITAGYRIDIGIYEYDYVIPNGDAPLLFEISAILEGAPVVSRKIERREVFKY